MIDYIATLLPRIQQFSKGLNVTAIFADIPWGFIDDDGDKVTYIFRRNNELLVSKKGDVTTGHWEYLPVMQSLLIEHAGRKRMYNQGFVDNVVMALRKDGTEELFLLANQQVLADLSAVGYLEGKADGHTIVTSSIVYTDYIESQLTNPPRFILIKPIEDRTPYKIGNLILDKKTGKPLENGIFFTDTGFKIEIENGKIKKVHGQEIFIFLFILIILIASLFLYQVESSH